MQSMESGLKKILGSLHEHPIEKATLDELVTRSLDEIPPASSPDNRRVQWEYILRNEVFALASTEGSALKDPNTKYYDQLRDRLDLVLTFTEHDTCDQSFPFNVLYDLLETQTIASCSHIFSWIEERADRLTEGMIPQKGKALMLLRTLNDLLRRLSKMGSTTKFCGRILTFLSRVFPLGERSGVNLRGEYGPMWDGPGVLGKTETTGETMQVDEESKREDAPSTSPQDKAQEQKDGFYRTFWSLQLPFSRPPLFAEPKTFSQFKEAVNKVIPVIKEATAKERALMGSKTLLAGTGASLKRKREPESVTESVGKEYFFAKYLTSPDLLDLEIADTHFRRQFLFQLLILLNYLLMFTKSAKAEWSTVRNRSLQIDFSLDGPETQWVQETIQKATEELRQTTPNGRAFAETVSIILERERNWIRWKNELCAPFDRETWSLEIEEDVEEGRKVKRKVGLEEATKDIRKKMREDPKEWEYSLGSASLTEIWEMGYRDLSDLQHPFQPGDVKDFVKKVKQEDTRIEMRKKQLVKTAERIAQARAKAVAAAAQAPSPPKPTNSATSEAPSTPRPISSAPAPTLHHPLPAKPGTSPPKPPPPAQPEPSPAATPAHPPVVAVTPAPEPVVLPPDDQIAKYEENKQRWSWLALRTVRDQHLQHFGKVGTGDVVALAREIEAEAEEAKDREQKPECIGVPPSQDDGGASPMIGSSSTGGLELRPDGETQLGSQSTRDGGGDVKMEG